jgi:hypothetical protein
MKNYIFCIFIVVILASCGPRPTVYENRTSEETWENIQSDHMVPDAPVSNERPLPNVLSEQEVLLKVADIALAEGVFDPENPIYDETPALRTARIETPILLTNADSGEPDAYMLNAVDDAGVLIATVSVKSGVNTSNTEFELGRGFAIPDTSFHYITKREAVELIQSQFPDDTTSDPMAVYNLRIDDDPYSHQSLFWYFTVSDSDASRSATGTEDEYILAADILGYRSIAGGVSNRTAIDGQGGSLRLDGYRMAKLNTPIRLFNKVNAARAVGGASLALPKYPDKSVGITPMRLK